MRPLLRTLLRPKRERRRVFLALAFYVLAQFGAQLHPYTHDAAALASVQQKIAVTHSLCDECLAYSPLLSATGTAAPTPRVPGPARSLAPTPRFVSFVDHNPRLAFRSRAPPKASPA